MSDVSYIIIGILFLSAPAFKYTVSEINKPKEITHIRHYDHAGDLIHYERYTGNVVIPYNRDGKPNFDKEPEADQ